MGSGARHLSAEPLLTLLEEVIMNIYELMNIHDSSDATLSTLLPLFSSIPAKSPQNHVSLCTLLAIQQGIAAC